MPNSTSSGDLLADKRFAYAEASAAEGDLAAAIDLYQQTIALVPRWAPVHLACGLALERVGETAQARSALADAARLDLEGALGAALHLARLTEARVDALPPAYVTALFDQYASRFDAHLTGALAYRGPEVILACLASSGSAVPPGATLDLGCGTGLMARALGNRAAPIDGVDLSAAMVAKARETGLYRTLLVGDCVATTTSMTPGGYGSVFAADVLVYLGDLQPLVVAVAQALAPGGLFCATAQRGDDTGFALGDDLRFRHSAEYLRRVLQEARFEVVALEPCTTRREAGHDVPGLVFVARAP